MIHAIYLGYAHSEFLLISQDSCRLLFTERVYLLLTWL